MAESQPLSGLRCQPAIPRRSFRHRSYFLTPEARKSIGYLLRRNVASVRNAAPSPMPAAHASLRKTVFNLVAPANEYEADFARFLDIANERRGVRQTSRAVRFRYRVHRFCGQPALLRAGLPGQGRPMARAILSHRDQGAVRDVDVAFKRSRAAIWAENASMLTETAWGYVKVPHERVYQAKGNRFQEVAFIFGGWRTSGSPMSPQ